MILLIPFIAYLVVLFSMILLSNQVLKNRSAEKRKKNRKRIIIFGSILLPVFGFMYFLFLFDIAVENHYNVKRGTFLWSATMDNTTITEFPIIEPIGEATYNKIGGDGPSISTGWEIEYESKATIDTLTIKILQYLRNEKYNLQEVDETQFNWPGKYKKNMTNRLYSGSNEIGESLDLIIQENENGYIKVECTVIY